MASSNFALFLLLTLLSSSLHTHAREPQFFNKVTTTTNNNNVVPNKEQPLNNPQEQEPNFLPQNENAYGLYGKESGKLPPSTTVTGEPTTITTSDAIPYNTEYSKQPLNKYLPKNYNPVAYVTEPEDITDSNSFTDEKSYTNNNYNGGQNYYNNNQQEKESEYRRYPTATNHNYYTGGSSYNSEPQGLSDTRFVGGATRTGREKYFNNGGETNSYKPQGMSDTRFMENGKYFYDVNAGKYSDNHPYASLRGADRSGNEYNNRNYYGKNENTYSMGARYQNQDEFQDEEGYNMP